MDIDVHTDNECVFRYSCQYGYLNIAKWLVSIFGDINIHAENDYAFRWSCENGHRNIIKWLVSNFTDIDIHCIENWMIYEYRLCNAITKDNEIFHYNIDEYAKDIITQYNINDYLIQNYCNGECFSCRNKIIIKMIDYQKK